MSRSRQIQNWILRAAGILLCLVLASTYLVCGMFARYTTTASGSDSARVAKFEIQEAGVSTIELNDPISPGDTIEKVLQVQNMSEVAVEYEVTIDHLGNLPLQFMVDNVDATENSFKRILPPNENNMNIYTLKIIWPAEQDSPDLAGLADYITVSVSATQVD